MISEHCILNVAQLKPPTCLQPPDCWSPSRGLHTCVPSQSCNFHQGAPAWGCFPAFLSRALASIAFGAGEKQWISILGHAPAQRQPHPVSAMGEAGCSRDCWTVFPESGQMGSWGSLNGRTMECKVWACRSKKFYVLDSDENMGTLLQGFTFHPRWSSSCRCIPMTAGNSSS